MAHQPINLKNALLWAAIALGGFTFQACSSDDDYPTVDDILSCPPFVH